MRVHIRSFLRWVPGAVFGVASLMIGVSPDQAANNLSEWYAVVASPPLWMQAPSRYYHWPMWISGILSLALFLWAGHKTWGNKKGPASQARENEHVPLHEAARLAYEEVERQLLGRLARGSRRGPLAFMAEKLFYEVPVVLGKRPPSTRLLPISESAGRAFRFSEDGGSLLDGQTPVFTDMCVTRPDFYAAMKSIRELADGRSVGSWNADEMVPLREAVGLALTGTRDTKLAAFITGDGSDEEQTVFGYFSAMLDRKTPIYGKTPPATDWVRLGRVDLSKETLWEMKSIKPHHEPVRMTDLSLRRGDLAEFVKAVVADG